MDSGNGTAFIRVISTETAYLQEALFQIFSVRCNKCGKEARDTMPVVGDKSRTDIIIRQWAGVKVGAVNAVDLDIKQSGCNEWQVTAIH